VNLVAAFIGEWCDRMLELRPRASIAVSIKGRQLYLHVSEALVAGDSKFCALVTLSELGKPFSGDGRTNAESWAADVERGRFLVRK